MRRLTVVLLLCAALAGCCQLSQDHMMVGYDLNGKAILLIERRAGQHCIWPQENVSAPTSECVEFDQWDDWKAVLHQRREMGAPLDACVYCQDGHYECPPED